MDAKVVNHLYQTFKKVILQETVPEKLFRKGEDFGLFCWSHYPGVYTDQQVENKLAELMLPSSDWISQPSEKHYVYIATRLFAVGGHSRCILHFIDNIRSAKHTLILLDQKKALPQNLQQFFNQSQTKLIRNEGNDFTSKSYALRKTLMELNPSRIFLFTHPNDLLPMITFGKFHPCTISLFNHADHTFWIGGKWIDSIIDFRSPGMAVTRKRRNVKKSELLLLPVDHTYEIVPKKAAKQHLGLSADVRIAGTLTNISKVQTDKNEDSFADFLRDSALIYPTVLFMVVGLNEDEFQSLLYKKLSLPSNIKCLGIVTDPDMYFKAFDYFIEPFPIASPLGMLDACKFGALPVFSPHDCYLAASYEALHHSISKICKRSKDKIELATNLKEAISYSDEMLAEKSEAIIRLIADHHRGIGWSDTLNDQQLLKQNIEEAPLMDPEKEMLFFQNYVKKSANELFEYLFQLKGIVNRKMLTSFFFGKNKLFSFSQLSKKNYKLLLWKLVKG